MAYASTNTYLQSFGRSADEVTAALDGGAAEIDGAFQVAGYVAPIDLAAMPAGEEKTRTTAKLADVNESLAAWKLSRGNQRAVPTPVIAAYEEAMLYLKGIREGKIKILGLPSNSRTSRAFAVVGTLPHPMPNAVFDGIAS